MADSKFAKYSTGGADPLTWEFNRGIHNAYSGSREFFKKSSPKPPIVRKSGAHVDDVLKSHELYGDNMVWLRLAGTRSDYPSHSDWLDYGKKGGQKRSPPMCPMSDMYIAVPKKSGYELVSANILFGRVPVCSTIGDPESRLRESKDYGFSLETKIAVSTRDKDASTPESAERARKLIQAADYVINAAYNTVSHFRDAIEEAYDKKYPKNTKEQKKQDLKRIFKSLSLTDEYATKIRSFYNRENDGTFTEVKGERKMKIDFNMRTPGSDDADYDLWSNHGIDKFKDSPKDVIKVITDTIVNIKDVKKSGKSAADRMVPIKGPITEHNIHELGLFKRGTEITGHLGLKTVSFSKAAVTVKVKMANTTRSVKRYIVVDASKAMASADQEDAADDVLAMAEQGNDDSEHDIDDAADELLGEIDAAEDTPAAAAPKKQVDDDIDDDIDDDDLSDLDLVE